MNTNETTATIAHLQVFPKHAPKPCACGTMIDTCCGPSTCPRCGRPTRDALNAEVRRG